MPTQFAKRLRPALGAAAALGVLLGCAAPAGAQGFPIPRCGWASRTAVQQTFGVPLRAKKPYWTTKVAPVLNCNFSERQANLQVPGKPIIKIQFRELSRLRPSSDFVPVAHLGSCRRRVSCTGGHAAWLEAQQATTGLAPYTASVTLGVQTGLNSIVIQVVNPFGPLPVSNEVASAEQLARKLARRFRWK